ncbi:MAG: cell division protein FtsZ [Candidatus Peregrinibacteria bacterium Gr01-1014_25]|nr:MAG: cell division protein FtsZ [Candidatus Peregrinibacteria bacterium Gr01-1014_25]
MSDTFRSLFSGSRSSGASPQGDDPVTPPSSLSSAAREVRPDMIPGATIRVLGTGGAGCNAVARMVTTKLHGVEFISVNTDVQALYHNPAPKKITIGRGTTRGLGAGANPQMGERAAQESLEEIKAAIEGTDMLFITAGMGGGTGGGSTHVIAELARSLGILTVGVVTRPFSFEGLKRRKQADEALEKLKGKVDTLITIPNDKILSLIDKTTPLTEAFQVVDEVLHHAIEGISGLITQHGLVNVDFADVKSVMQDAGSALMGIGYGTGDSRAAEAARAAIDSPLLELSINGAQGILFNITGGNDLSMFEVDEAARIITETAAPEATIIFGAVIDENYTGQVKCTVVATGFDVEEKSAPAQQMTPAQRYLTKAAPTARDAKEEKAAPQDAGFRSSAVQLNEEELEVPAFMRKPISK